MSSFLLVAVAVLSLAGCVNAYIYDADGLTTATLAMRCLYAFIFLVLTGVSVIALAIARGHRLPFMFLFVGLLLSFFQMCAGIATSVLFADVDPFDDFPGDAIVGTSGVETFFFAWTLAFVFLAFCLLIKAKADSIAAAPENSVRRLSPIWAAGAFAGFVILFIFGTASAALYVRYARVVYIESERVTRRETANRRKLYENMTYVFSALWYGLAFYLGALAFLAYSSVRKAGVQDNVTKTLLFVAFPLHVVHVIVEIIFTILFSPAGLENSIDNITTLEQASLAYVILTYLFHAATAAVLIMLGLQRTNWSPKSVIDWSRQSYPVQAAYPVQGNYAMQPVQATYPIQQTYPAQNQYVDNSQSHLNPQAQQ